MVVWRDIFLEIALRAIRKVHYDFGIWELGQEKIQIEDFSKLNQGYGINFAPEESVRDAITQEVLLTGMWKQHEIEGEKRSYWIDREVKVSYKPAEIVNTKLFIEFMPPNGETLEKNKYFHVDLVLKRVEEETKDGAITIPTLIEAKRYELLKVNLQTKKVKVGAPQIKDIDNDILKLKLIKEIKKDKGIKINSIVYRNFRTYMLVWGISNLSFDIKTGFIKYLKHKEFVSSSEMCIKEFPVSWTKKMRVTKKIWIALFEIE